MAARLVLVLAVAFVLGCQVSSRAQLPSASTSLDTPEILTTISAVQSWSHDLLAGVASPAAPLSSVLLEESPELSGEQETVLRRARVLVAYGGPVDELLVNRYRELHGENATIIVLDPDAGNRHEWLNPVTARESIERLAQEFQVMHSADAERIASNAEALLARVEQAERRIRALQAPWSGTPVLVESRGLLPLIESYNFEAAAVFQRHRRRPPTSEETETWNETVSSLQRPLMVSTRQLAPGTIAPGENGPTVTLVVVNPLIAGFLGQYHYAHELERNALLTASSLRSVQLAGALADSAPPAEDSE